MLEENLSGSTISYIVLAAGSYQLLLSLLCLLRPQRDGIEAGGTLTLIISLNATLSLKPAFDVILSLEFRVNETTVLRLAWCLLFSVALLFSCLFLSLLTKAVSTFSHGLMCASCPMGRCLQPKHGSICWVVLRSDSRDFSEHVRRYYIRFFSSRSV